MSILSTLFPAHGRTLAPTRGVNKQSIAVFHGTNRMAGSTAPRRGVASLGALNNGGGISPGGHSNGGGGHGGGRGK
jgi:hypothetical protein